VRGCVAIERGPLVYCVEQADLPAGVLVEQLRLEPSATIVEERTEDGVRLRLPALITPLDTTLYQPHTPAPSTGTPITITAIPYQTWANRTPGAMRVWLPLT
jgi:DUF1680 family protein